MVIGGRGLFIPLSLWLVFLQYDNKEVSVRVAWMRRGRASVKKGFPRFRQEGCFRSFISRREERAAPSPLGFGGGHHQGGHAQRDPHFITQT